MNILKISTTEDPEGKHKYELRKDGKLIARGTAEHETIVNLFYWRYTPMVVYVNF